MKTLILYKSQHGATKQYARWIHEELPGSDLFNMDDFDSEKIDDYDTVIAGSCVYGGQMPGLEFLQVNWEELKGKRVFFFTVGLIPPDSQYSQQMYESIPKMIRDSVSYAKLPGQITYMHMNFIQKWAFKLFAKGDTDTTIDREKIAPILEFAKAS